MHQFLLVNTAVFLLKRILCSVIDSSSSTGLRYSSFRNQPGVKHVLLRDFTMWVCMLPFGGAVFHVPDVPLVCLLGPVAEWPDVDQRALGMETRAVVRKRCPSNDYLSQPGISWMFLCDRSRRRLKIDASDLTVSVVLKLLYSSSCGGLMSPLMLFAVVLRSSAWICLVHCVGNRCSAVCCYLMALERLKRSVKSCFIK